MLLAIAGSQRSWNVFGIFCAVVALMGLAGAGYAQDAKARARTKIRLYKATISKANSQINNLTGRIISGNLLIITAELAVREAKKKKNNEVAVLALQLSLAALKSKTNDLVKEKQSWERYKGDCQKALAQWEAYLRKIGG